MDFKAQIEKLEGTKNWTKWKRQVELLLRHNDVLDLVLGDRERPSDPGNAATAEQFQTYEAKLKSFMKNDALAQLILVNSMDDANIELTATCDSAKCVWEKLLAVYEQSSGQRVDRLMELFFSSDKDPAEDIVTHVARLQRNFSELNDELKRLVKTELPDLLLMSRIMSTLPTEYFEFKSVWESVPVQERTINKLTERLRLIEMRLPCKQSESTALVAKSSVKKKEKGKFDRKCFNCNRRGHIAKFCNKKNEASKRPDGDAFVCIAGIPDSELWLADSGASAHMTGSKQYFLSYKPFAIPKEVRIGNNEVILAYGEGIINVEMLVNKNWERNHLTDVWYVPEVSRNLFSISKAVDKGFKFKVDKNGCVFLKNEKVKMAGKRTSRGLYALEMRVSVPDEAADVYIASENTLQLWHERLCHQNKRHVKEILQKEGIEVKVTEEFCEGCLLGKQQRKSFGTRKDRATVAGDLIHADVCGPMQQRSIGGARYFVCLKDDFSKYRRVFFIQNKSEVANCIKNFVNEAEAAGNKIKEFLSDGGKEFDNADVQRILASRGITKRIAMPYTPEQNGCAERENRTLVESARSLLHAKNLPIKLWAEAVNTVVYTLNRTGPTPLKGKNPYELWFSKEVMNIDHFVVFGTECFVHVPKQKRRKWDQKSIKGNLVGYCGEKDGYRIWLPSDCKVILSRDVIFKEEKPLHISTDLPEIPDLSRSEENENVSFSINDKIDEDCQEEDRLIDEQVHNLESDEEDCTNVNRDTVQGRSQRKTKLPSYLHDYVLLAQCNGPDSYSEAIESNNSREWQSAMDEEMASLAENKVWHLVDLPPGKKPISNRWVLRIKTKADGSIDRYKARLVVKGYYQKQGIDYDETFSPVARFDTVRAVLSVAAAENLQLLQFDIKTAFLYGELEEEIYMKQPEGYSDGTDRVCKLDRSLYGLKQAPRCWNNRFVNFIKNQRLSCSTADPCLFYRISGGKKFLIVIYVDDGLVAATDSREISEFVASLKAEFKITVGSLDCFLGMHITKLDDGSIFVAQGNYCNKILEKFNMLDANAVATPCERGQQNDTESALDQRVPYREAVGSLMYLSTATRPDIAYAVSVASENLDSPMLSHWQAVKRIFRYLKGTANYGLLYRVNFDQGELKAYSDADYAGDLKTRRSRTGVLCMYAGAAITWASSKQKSVVLSTTEAEYVAACEATKEVIWLKRLFGEISELKSIPTLLVDNASAIKLVKNPEFHKRSKHIEIKFHFIREKYQEQVINVDHVNSNCQVADILTKPLARVIFNKLRLMLGQSDCNI